MTSDPETPIAADAASMDTLVHAAATLEILQIISRSRDDEEPVFDAILQKAAQLCGAPMASLNLLQDNGTRLVLTRHWGRTLEHYEPGITEWPLDGVSVPAQAVRESQIVHIEDLAETEAYKRGDPTRVRSVDNEGIRTFLAVPLMQGLKAIGCIALFRREVRPFAQSQITLVRTFAEQAVIAIENVRQFLELRTRLRREAATREILQVISRSRDDEKPVFDAILERAAHLCAAPNAALMLVNEGATHFYLAAAWGEWPKPFDRATTWRVDGPLPVAEAIRTIRTIHIEDMADSAAYRAGDPTYVELVEIDGLRTRLCVPLVHDGTAFGVISLSRREVKPFSVDEITLVETFAAQAVIAIENVRQFRELQTRLEREAATREILQVISRSRADAMPVFQAILENARRLCKAPMAMLSVANGERTRVSVPASLGAREAFAKALETFDQPIDAPLIAVRPVADGRIIHMADCTEDELYRDRHPTRVLLADIEGVRTILAVPMISNGISIGAIMLYRREVQPFDDDQIELVKTFADQAAIAVENVRQFNALEARTQELRELNSSLERRVKAQVGEIERMGRLKRFLSPAVADAVVSSGDEKMLSSHRAKIAVLFCDIRGFTAFCETAEPEEAIDVLQTYHKEMGQLMQKHGAGVDHRMGDGIMVIFNDPLPCDDPAGDAVRLALAMRARMQELCKGWRKLGHRLGFGVGISFGYATVGMVGSEGRYDYTASGTAVNLGARLCDYAEDGEILLSLRAATSVGEDFPTESIGKVDLKGIREPVELFRLIAQPT